MQIRAITIENFKSIKHQVRIELRPITLLYGANSVGKSTIIQALHYAREIFIGNGVDIDKTDTGGEQIRLGGFSSFVNDQDKNNILRIKLEFDLSENHKNPIEEEEIEIAINQRISDGKENLQKFFAEQIRTAQYPWIELVIEWDFNSSVPYMSIGSLGFGENHLMSVNFDFSDPSRIKNILCLQNDSPVFNQENINNMASLCSGETNQANEAICQFVNQCNKTCTALHVNVNLYHDIKMNHLSGSSEELPWITLGYTAEAIWLSVVNFAKNDLQDFRYLGPLRLVPELPFTPSAKYFEKWDTGLAAWNCLALGSPWDLHIVNSWLSKKSNELTDGFNTGYHVVREQFVELDVNSSLYKHLISDHSEEGFNETGHVKDLPVITKLSIKQTASNILLQPKAMGVGISQLLPIIPLACGGGWDNDGIVSIEQPELHIHPAMQVVLGDLFIEGLEHENNMLSRKRYILETHSEHLLLRLLRRLREPVSDGYILQPDDFGIYFIESTENGIVANRIRVNNDGEFVDSWPKGFFSERAEELF